MKIRPLSEAGLRPVLAQMRARDRAEVFACRFDDSIDWLAADILACEARAILSGLACAADGEPVAVFGAYARTPSAAECALIATDRWPAVSRSMTRWVHREAIPMLTAAGIRRLEARALEAHDDSRRWLTGLGAHAECTVPRFGRSGETFVQYALYLDDTPSDDPMRGEGRHVLYADTAQTAASAAP